MRSYTQYLNQAGNRQRTVVAAIIPLVCLFSLATVTPAVAATSGSDGEVLSFTRADLNDDGAVNFADLIIAMDYLENRGTLRVIEAFDVINDGKIDAGDLYGLAHIAGAPGSGFLPERMRIVRGDLNDDGNIDLTDARILEFYLEQGGRIIATALDAADLDNNGVIDTRDMARLDNMVGSGNKLEPVDNGSASTGGKGDSGPAASTSRKDSKDGSTDFELSGDKPSRDHPNPRVIDYPAPEPTEPPTTGPRSDTEFTDQPEQPQGEGDGRSTFSPVGSDATYSDDDSDEANTPATS